MPLRDVTDPPIREVVSEDGIVTVHLGRHLVLEGATVLRRGLMAALDRQPRPRQVVLDLSAVRRVDTAGVAAMIEGLAHARARGVALVLGRVSPQARRMLDLFHLGTLLPTEGEAQSPE